MDSNATDGTSFEYALFACLTLHRLKLINQVPRVVPQIAELLEIARDFSNDFHHRLFGHEIHYRVV